MDAIYVIVRIVVALYLIRMSVMDVKEKRVELVSGIIIMGAAGATLLVAGVSPVSMGMGIAVGGGLYVISRISRGSVGEGDAFIYALTGAVLGFMKNLELLFIALIFSAIVGGFLLVIKKVGARYKMPFVPFTLAGYAVVVIFG